jgi:hypothetical protein
MATRLRRSRSNVRSPLRWTVESASNEFKLSAGAVRKNLLKAGVESDESGCYSTEQVCLAVFGGLNEEKLATQRELTKKYALDNQIVEASVLNRAALARGLAAIADAMVCRIMVSELSRETKEDLLRDLASIPVVLDSVASRQSKLRRSKNGQAVEEDGSES